MESGAKIGNVIPKGVERREWIIPDFSTLPGREGVFFRSPDFHADGSNWWMKILPNGIIGDGRIHIMLVRISPPSEKRGSCTVGVRKACGSEVVIGTQTCGDVSHSVYVSRRRRSEIEEWGWLSDGQLTVTCFFRGVHAWPEVTASVPLDVKRKRSRSVVDENSRRDVSQPPEAKANTEFTSRETQTGAMEERLDNCTNTGAKGVTRLGDHVKRLLTEGNEDDYDVRILVKGREFRAHRLILKARSPVLAMMLTHDSIEKNSGIINIEDCDPDCFEDFLLFVYSGRVENLTPSKALGLYYAAEKYDFPDLKEECVRFLEASLSLTSVCDVVLLAATHGESRLLRTATEYFVRNIKTMLLSVDWQNLLARNPTVANELYIVSLRLLGHL